MQSDTAGIKRQRCTRCNIREKSPRNMPPGWAGRASSKIVAKVQLRYEVMECQAEVLSIRHQGTEADVADDIFGISVWESADPALQNHNF